MIFITGGKYQGKEEFALRIGGYSKSDVLDLSDLDFFLLNDLCDKYKIVSDLQEYIRYLSNDNNDINMIEANVKELIKKCEPEIIIMTEVGAGVVPLNERDNLFREATGALSKYYANIAKEVYRVICSVAVKLK